MKSSTPRDAVRLSPNAITVLEKRYLIKDDTGVPVESPRDLFQRVAATWSHYVKEARAHREGRYPLYGKDGKGGKGGKE